MNNSTLHIALPNDAIGTVQVSMRSIFVESKNPSLHNALQGYVLMALRRGVIGRRPHPSDPHTERAVALQVLKPGDVGYATALGTVLRVRLPGASVSLEIPKAEVELLRRRITGKVLEMRAEPSLRPATDTVLKMLPSLSLPKLRKALIALENPPVDGGVPTGV
jgi:hypothetical protein